MNVEHRTLNIELRMWVSLRSIFLIKLKRQRRTLIRRWTFDVGRSFFNPTFVTRSAGACAACWIFEFEIYPPKFGGGLICNSVLGICIFRHRTERQRHIDLNWPILRPGGTTRFSM